MVIETDNLVIRSYTADDAGALYPILSDAETMSFWPAPFTPEQVRHWLDRTLASYAEHGFGRNAVMLKGSDELIGDCGIMRSLVAGQNVNDLGYIFHKNYWGKGYATEAARAVMTDAFERLGLDVLHANMAYNNKPSRRVAERLGMTKIREFTNERNRNIWTLLYAIRNDRREPPTLPT
jgi:ribosomal-protein-alanine N-acetyltransferase